jgi:hypothetical protein
MSAIQGRLSWRSIFRPCQFEPEILNWSFVTQSRRPLEVRELAIPLFPHLPVGRCSAGWLSHNPTNSQMQVLKLLRLTGDGDVLDFS